MTGRTHDLAAFTALNLVVATIPLSHVTLPTVLVAFGANFIGALAPDIDQPTAKFWRNTRGGTFWGRLIAPLFGGHRFISHSLIGIIIAGFLLSIILDLSSSFLLVDMSVVWWAFMIGYVSHLITDTMTKDGVPWLFPIPWKFGFPPLHFLRITTGGNIEKYLVFPLLMIANGYIFYLFQNKYLELFRSYLQ